MAELKKHNSIDQQLTKLQTRKVKITNRESAAELLSNFNYYRLSGYLYSFKNVKTDCYGEGIYLTKIKRIYDFDRKFSRILMFALEDIEETLKTRLSYTVTSRFPDDPIIYLKPTIYRSYEPYVRFLSYFYREVENNRNLPFVKHHILNYDGFLPMWVAVELFTMGNLHSVYDNLETEFQKAIAKEYNAGPKQLSNWLENLTYIRNHLAHFMRIYRFNFGRTPMVCKGYGRNFSPSYLIFDQIYIISRMYSDVSEWNNYVMPEMRALLDEYENDVSLPDVGFPDNWESILSRR